MKLALKDYDGIFWLIINNEFLNDKFKFIIKSFRFLIYQIEILIIKFTFFKLILFKKFQVINENFILNI